VETAPGESEIAVVELFNPTYNPTNRGVTYDVAVLENWEESGAFGFREEPADLATLAPAFGTAHLLIDDCPADSLAYCLPCGEAEPCDFSGQFRAALQLLLACGIWLVPALRRDRQRSGGRSHSMGDRVLDQQVQQHVPRCVPRLLYRVLATGAVIGGEMTRLSNGLDSRRETGIRRNVWISSDAMWDAACGSRTGKERSNMVHAASLSRRRLMAMSAGTAVATLAPYGRIPSMMAQPATPQIVTGDASPRFQEVVDALAQAMTDLAIPGGAVGVYHDGRMESAVAGLADVAAGTPVTPDTLFGMGSVSKTYTATAIMRLAETGRLDIDGLVRDYVPDLALADEEVAEQVTVRHLLTHTGGWYGDPFVETGAGDDALVRFISSFLPTFPQIAPLGRYFSYNNSGFVLLGYLIETVAGKPYRDALAELVLEPLGLDHATFDPAGILARPHVTGYTGGPRGDALVSPLFMPRNLDSTGGLWTTIDQQLRYAAFHLGDGMVDGETVVSAARLEAMRTPQAPFPETPNVSIGMNWAVTEAGGRRVALHSGQTFSQNATIFLIPEENFAVAVLTNAVPGIAMAAMAAYLGIGDAVGSIGTSDAPEAVDGVAPVEIADLAEYAGRFETPQQTVNVREESDGLRLDFEYHVLVEDVLPDTFIVPSVRDLPVHFTAPDLAILGDPSSPAGTAAFLRDDDGQVEWVSFGRVLKRTA
jgi:CubicO group peptidase (beta-lactamase class C family)